MTAHAIKIAPSILSADFRCLEREVKDAEQAGADFIHCDVMDGSFVPNITFGPLVVEAVRKCVSIPLDVHLMIVNPDAYIDAFCQAGATILTFHAEASSDIAGDLDRIAAHGVGRGVTVNPDKPAELFLPHLESIDQVLIMTVYAGFGGQKFIAEMLDKIRQTRAQAEKRRPQLDIEVDGGVNHETAADCAAAGANVLVAGSYIFGAEDYRDRIDALRAGAAKGQTSGKQSS
ncbi:MAG: ribulose-phosphate 3-epimerase [Chitinivibrionales bacterium]|nr:ribulose-phosphate 3-epimerase [Chitinivibrionales bacterium]